jgi:sortase A
MVVTGLALLGWCALVTLDGWIAQRAAQLQLETVALPAVPMPQPGAAVRASSPVSARPVSAARGAALATLSLPRIGLSAVVLQGSDARTLRRGPGHLESSALPGETGNDVIAGHRDLYFRPLRNVAVGDDVFLDSPDGRVHYRVAWTRVVNPHDVSVLAPSDGDVLTLITCYPFWVVGNAPDRFVVRAVKD